MNVNPVLKEKVKALLRAQVEFDPESAIAQMDAGNVVPACELFCKIMGDMRRRCEVLQAYSNKVVAIIEEVKKEVGA